MRRRRGVAVVGLLLAAPACAGAGGPTPTRLLPPGPETVDVTMREYSFDLPETLPRGRVVFRARNAGRLPHEMALVVLGEDVPPIAEELRNQRGRVVRTLASVPSRAPGSAGTFAVDLKPGRYGVICFVLDQDGEQHARKGMASEFRVAAPPG